jgi:ABC-type glycerol-3-phosphate transport system substrate-binding protein
VTTDLLQFLPKYHQIKEALRAELLRLPPESRLPGVRALRDRFQTSLVTLDRALRELENEGLIRREHGRGMFVAGPPRPPTTLNLVAPAGLCALEEPAATQALRRFQQSEGNTRVLVDENGGTPPDVYHVNTLSFLSYAEELLPLDELLPPEDLQRFDPRALAPFQRGERTLALPRLFCPWVLYYNCDLFDRAGLPYPSADWRWADLLDATRRLTRRSEGQYGYLALEQFRCRLQYIWQNGGELFDPVSGACRLTADEVVEALEFWRELEQRSPLERETRVLEELYRLFLSGRLAMFPWAGWLRVKAQASPRCRWGVAPLPAGRRRAALLVAEAYGVARSTRDPEAALRLTHTLVSTETLREQAAAGYPLVVDPAVHARFPVEPAFEESLAWARVSREYEFRDEMRLIEHEFSRAWEENAAIPATCRRVQAIVSSLIDSRKARPDHRELS